jgi:hypothetical protein
MYQPRRRTHGPTRGIQLGDPRIALDVNITRQSHCGKNADNDDNHNQLDQGETI